jgi:hypothetical protein
LFNTTVSILLTFLLLLLLLFLLFLLHLLSHQMHIIITSSSSSSSMATAASLHYTSDSQTLLTHSTQLHITSNMQPEYGIFKVGSCNDACKREQAWTTSTCERGLHIT